jgi:hypothetical protein
MNNSKQRTYLAVEALTAGDSVMLNDDGNLLKVTTAGILRTTGVAATDAASGAYCAVKFGRNRLPASGTLLPGQRVEYSAVVAGTVVAQPASGWGSAVIGFAEEPVSTSGDTSGTVLVWLN